jgi:hypothetical protein
MAPYTSELRGREEEGYWRKSFWDVKEQKNFWVHIFNVRVDRSRNYVMSPGRKFEETAFCDM